MLLALGLLGSLEISTDTPDALCPPPESARRAIVERVGEIQEAVTVRYGVVHGAVGGSTLLHITISKAGECGPRLDRTYPLESASCEDGTELLATVVEGFTFSPPPPPDCSEWGARMHAGLVASTVASFGAGVGVSFRHLSGWSWSAFGGLEEAPFLASPVAPTLSVWGLSGRLTLSGGYAVNLGTRAEAGLALGAGPAFDAGSAAESGSATPRAWSRFALVGEARAHLGYRLGGRWAADLTLSGSWFFYREPLWIEVLQIANEGGQDEITTGQKQVEMFPEVQGRLGVGLTCLF